eukprot:Nitzschia sp. Nitz4//scaffold5_size260463//29201//29684//NITZ4_000943-RA/size260463-processed-gene-0.291-mRNA-1//1//CDS//3329555223//2891//frame0
MTSSVETREIPVHVGAHTPTEYAMVELNGELISPTEIPTKENQETVLGGNDRVELGRLQLGPDDKTPVLILGSHLLKGKVEKLKEPFCLMKRQYDENEVVNRYDVIGVVEKKLIFNQYPKVIMR